MTEGIDAQPVHGYKLIKGDESFTISYEEVEKDVHGLGLRNGKLLTNIRSTIREMDNVTLIEGNVTELIEGSDTVAGVKYETKDGTKTASAPLTVVSDGPMSFFRNKLSKPNKQVSSFFMGLVLRDLPLEFPAHGHMIVTGDAPILVYPIHNNGYRILIDYPGTKPPRIGPKSIEKLKAQITESLPKEMIESFHNAIDNDQLKVMPNHSMKAQAFRKRGAVLLGDSLNMRHPITGGGMTATFSDILELNKQLKGVDLKKAADVESRLLNYYENRSEQVETINILANALYKVFRDDEMKDAVFEYLHSGGEKSKGPLSLLAGLNRDKKILLKHFFNVALQHPVHFITRPKKQIRLYRNAVKIIRPILREEQRPTLV